MRLPLAAGACAVVLAAAVAATGQTPERSGKRSLPSPARLGTDRLRPTGGIPGVGFYCLINPEGSLLATSERYRVCVWHLPAGTVAREISFPDAFSIEPLLWSTDGQQLLVLEGLLDGNHRYHVVNARTGHVRPLDDELPGGVNEKTGAPAAGHEDYIKWALRSWGGTRNPRDSKPPWCGPAGRLVETPLGWELAVIAGVAGPMLATGHPDGTIRLWANDPIREVRRIQAHRRPISHLVSSSDGRLLLSQAKAPESGEKARAEDPRPAREGFSLWDVKTGRPFASFASAVIDHCTDVQFSPDGCYLAVLDWKRGLSVWDLKAGVAGQEARLSIGGVSAFAFSRDGKLLALARRSGVVDCIDLVGRRQQRRLRTYSPYVQQVLFLPDNRTLVVSDRVEIGLWDISSGKELDPGEGHRRGVGRLLFSPDGRLLASADAWGKLLVWSVADRTTAPVFSGERHRNTLHFCFEANGRSLLTLEPSGDIRSWPITRKPTSGARTVVHVSPLVGWTDDKRHSWDRVLAFSHRGSFAVFRGTGGDMYISDLRTGGRASLPFLDPGAVTLWCFSPDEKVLAVHCGEEDKIYFWDLEKKITLATIDGDGRPDPTFLFSPDSRTFAYKKGDSIRLYAVRRKAHLPELSPLRSPCPLAFDASGRTLMTVESDNVLKLWDWRTKRVLRRGFAPDVASWDGALRDLPCGVMFTSDVFLDKDRRGRLHDPATGFGVVPPPSSSRLSDIPHIAVSPDGRVVAVGKVEVTLHDRYTTKQVGRLPQAHRGQVTALMFSPSGDRLAIAAEDSSIYLWDWKQVCGLHDPRRLILSEAQLIRCWHALAGDDPRATFAAMGLLRSAPEQALPFLRRHLHPAGEAELRPARRLVANLDSDDFATRGQASARLVAEMRGEWVPLLHQEVAENPSLEVTTRLQQALVKTSSFAFSPAMLRRIRAAHLLEEIGSPEAAALLARLAAGSDLAPLTHEARRAFDRLKVQVK